MKKCSLKLITILLSLLMCVQMFPFQVIAANTDQTMTEDITTEESDFYSEETTEEEAYVLHEAEQYRDTNTKHYRMSDGSYTAAEFPNAVHYENENNEFVDIDNTLVISEDGYVNTDNLSEYIFSDSFEGYLLSLNHNGYGISMNYIEPLSIEDIGNSIQALPKENVQRHIEISNPGQESFSAGGDGTTVMSIDTEDESEVNADDGNLTVEEYIRKNDKSSSSIKYVNISEGIDLRYDLIGDSLKEYIILKEKPNTNMFSFGMSFTSLTPILNEDKSIDLTDENGESIFTIPAPYMTDDAGEISYDCEYSLEQVPQGYILNVTVSEEWLNSEDRVYPVMVDPTISVSRKNNSYNTDIVTDYYSVAKNMAYGSGTSHIFMGYDSSGDGEYRTYIKVNTLPTLPVNTIPISSAIHIAQQSYGNVGLSKLTVSAREVTSTGSWYNNYSSTALDYTTLSADTNLTYVYWDVTEAAKKWYSSNNANNYGIVFISEQSFTNTECAKATMRGYSSASQINGQPIFVVKYRHTVGIEDRFTYLTQSAGNAGSGYVRLNDGALSAERADIYYESVSMPVGISYIYNNVYSDINFTGTYVYNGQTYPMPLNTCDYTQMYVGRGWKLNLQQTIVETSITNADNTVTTYKIYTDADGTEHYFLLDEDAELASGDPEGTKIYVDEDGLGLKIKDIGNSEHKLINDQDTVYSFKNGYLYKMEDANGNYIRIYYGNASSNNTVDNGMPSTERNRIVKVTQKNVGESAEKTIATLTYDSNKQLTSITDYAGQTVSYSYTGNSYLSYVTETDGGISRYYYDADNSYRMTAIYDSQIGYGIRYTYGANGTIDSFTEYSVENSVEQTGAKYLLEVLGNGVSYVTDTGADRNPNSADDIITTYLFDNSGRTVNCYSSNQKMNGSATGSFRIYGSSVAAYMSDSVSNTRTKNRIVNSAQTGGVATNLIVNPGAENGKTNWSGGSVSAEEKRNGNNSFKISGAKQLSQTRQLAVGTYTLSTYVKVTAVANDTQVYLKCGTKTSRVLREQTADGQWERLSVTFDVVMAGNNLMVLQTKGSSTVVYADDFQLEVGEGASRVNLLDNGNMENWGGNWITRVTGSADFTTETSMPGGNYSLKLSGVGERNVLENTTVLTGVKAGESFVVSGWAKANSVPINDKHVNAELGVEVPEGQEVPDYKPQSRFKLYAMVKFTDGSTPQWFQNSFNADIVDQWQYLSIMVVPHKDVASITVGVCYGNNNGYAYFDNISLIREDVVTYRYDGDGYYESVTTSTSNEPENYTFNAGNLISVTHPGKGTYDYTYQTSGNTHLATSVTTDVLKTVFEYNTAGQNTKSTLMNKDNENLPKIESTVAYTPNRDHVSSITDSNGISASYTYNSKNQLTKTTSQVSDTAGSGNVSTVQTYDSTGRNVSSYISGTVSLGYKYSGGRLEWIERGGYITSGGTKQEQAYAFEYDRWGNTTVNKIGYIDKKNTSDTADDEFVGSPLAAYSYNAGNGDLNRMDYASGYSITYSYDVLGRIKSESYLNSADTELYRNAYYYNGDGSLSRMEKIVDNAVTNTIYYNYDGIGRIVEISEYEGSTLVDRVSYGYDDISRTNKTTVKGGENEVTSTYTYDEDDGKVTELENVYSISDANTADNFEYTYDHLNRMNSKKLTHGATELTQSYGYANNISNPGRTSMLINSVDYTVNTDTDSIYSFDYIYDNIGNIKQASVTCGNVTHTVKYYYDKQGQLVMEANEVIGETYIYEYDTYGNIRYKYTLDGSGFANYADALECLKSDPHNTFSYSYGNNLWKDQLTAYNDTNFTYDSLGNPLAYFNGDGYVFEWSNGRELASAEVNGETVNYTYNSSGLRTSKIYNDGSTHNFYYAGDKLISQVWDEGTRYLNFLYDESGSIYGFTYHDGWDYYFYRYVKNLQGDIVAILDHSGSVVVKYTYDAWGNILATTDGNGNAIAYSADHIANINPIRYRGYYYDTETGFYYLQSRYYDPYLGRFINADGYMTTGQGFLSYNMYAYCGNNPVNYYDPDGCYAKKVFIELGKVLGEVIAEVVSTYSYGPPPPPEPTPEPPKNTSTNGVAFISNYEGGWSSKPYDDGSGYETIGYGHKILPNESFTDITHSEALALLASDLSDAEGRVVRYSEQLGIKWDQNQFDALVSLSYNSGYCVNDVIDELYKGINAYDAFGMIVYSAGKYNKGLYNRRMDEAELFLFGDYIRDR